MQDRGLEIIVQEKGMEWSERSRNSKDKNNKYKTDGESADEDEKKKIKWHEKAIWNTNDLKVLFLKGLVWMHLSTVTSRWSCITTFGSQNFVIFSPLLSE